MKVQRLQRTPAVWRDCLNYLNIRRWNSLILLVLLAGIPRYLIGRDVPPGANQMNSPLTVTGTVYDDAGQPLIGVNTVETGYHIIKVYEPIAAYATYNTSATPAITLRFAEALLNYAEAMAELGTITQADLDISINRLRDRVGMPHMDLNNIPVDPRYVNDGVSPLIVEIRRERRIELFMEGFRYDDLRRWKQGKKLEIPSMGVRYDAAAQARYPGANVASSMVDGVPYVDVYKGTDWEDPVFDENKHYLWPIPLSVISQNPNVQQNPGW